ncbi:hypothetical protein L3Q82_005138 [Scortum barcoo]|uniref:Uncharacterized protein n=1 Tax=Scortum barcoo TaxID=214431 RepID=A0ACB8VEX8_9TELE|nr:hypothetical protein L3Q82_005138 [Scortum barcoo]
MDLVSGAGYWGTDRQEVGGLVGPCDASVILEELQRHCNHKKKTMTINFVSLIFIWLLSLTTSSQVTPGQSHSSTNVVTDEIGNHFAQDQETTQGMSSSNPLSEVAGNLTHSTVVEVNATEEKSYQPTTKPSLQTTQKMPPKTFLPNIKTAATPTNPISSPLNTPMVGMKSTAGEQKVTTSPTMGVTSQASNLSTTTRAAMQSSSTISQDAAKTLTAHPTHKITHPPTDPTQSPNLISTTITSTKSAENKSTSTGFYKTSTATTQTPFIHITKAKKRQDSKSKKGTNDSKAVAGIIGGALVLMIAGFLLIYIKKRKLQRQQITTTDWAGPSPFLEDGADNGQVTLRSSNRISLSSFLPLRLSKRLSLLPETDEELVDMTSGTTFGDKHQGSTFGREVDGNDGPESNGTAIVVQEQSTGDVPKTAENSVSVSSEMKEPLSTNNNSEVANLSEDHPANPPTLSGADEDYLAKTE